MPTIDPSRAIDAMPPRTRLIRVADTRRTRWKNDGGWTTEITSEPASASGHGVAEDFRWRVSIADIEKNGPFSTFPGVDRDLLLLTGNGIELDVDDDEPRRLERRFEHLRFAGEQRVDCRLLAGPTCDFNVMVRRAAVRADVVARPLTGSMLIFQEPATTWLVHVFAGHAESRIDEQVLNAQAGETLRFDAGSTSRRIILEGVGELVLVKFEETPARTR